MSFKSLEREVEALEKGVLVKDADFIIVWICEHGTELNILNGEYVVRNCNCYENKSRLESS